MVVIWKEAWSQTVEAISCKKGLAICYLRISEWHMTIVELSQAYVKIVWALMGFRFVKFVQEGRRSDVDAHNLTRSCIFILT